MKYSPYFVVPEFILKHLIVVEWLVEFLGLSYLLPILSNPSNFLSLTAFVFLFQSIIQDLRDFVFKFLIR